jgi:hypothetical protein
MIIFNLKSVSIKGTKLDGYLIFAMELSFIQKYGFILSLVLMISYQKYLIILPSR